MSDPPRLIERPQGQQLEQETPVEFHIPSSDPLKPVIIEASHVNKLARHSVQLRSLLKDARQSRKPFVVLKCRAGDGTNLSTLEWVLQQLPNRKADPGVDTCDAPTLCAACNVLFKYECLPTAFAGFSTKVFPGSSARSIASERLERVRCWQVKRMVESTTKLAGQLMTIALVLGDKDLFRAELATMIWRAELVSLDTSVEKLVDLHGKIAPSCQVLVIGTNSRHFSNATRGAPAYIPRPEDRTSQTDFWHRLRAKAGRVHNTPHGGGRTGQPSTLVARKLHTVLRHCQTYSVSLHWQSRECLDVGGCGKRHRAA